MCNPWAGSKDHPKRSKSPQGPPRTPPRRSERTFCVFGSFWPLPKDPLGPPEDPPRTPRDPQSDTKGPPRTLKDSQKTPKDPQGISEDLPRPPERPQGSPQQPCESFKNHKGKPHVQTNPIIPRTAWLFTSQRWAMEGRRGTRSAYIMFIYVCIYVYQYID